MSEPIVTKESIAQLASAAAERFVRTGLHQVNDFPAGSDAAAEWKRRYEIAILRLSAAKDAEASA